MKFGRDILGDYYSGSSREFLLTNGIGGSSSAAINGNSTRRYHSLLSASLVPPLDRVVLVHKVTERFDSVSTETAKFLSLGEEKIADGFLNLESFEYDFFPKFRYFINGSIIEKELFMIYGKNCTVIKYKTIFSQSNSIKVSADIFLNYRDIHIMGAEIENDDFSYTLSDKNELVFMRKGLEFLKCSFPANSNYFSQKEIIKGICYEIEKHERGESLTDSSLLAGSLEFEMERDKEYFLAFYTPEIEQANWNELYNGERDRIAALREQAGKDSFVQDLAQAADSFIVRRESTDGMTLLAGYPWFSDWGRDTMIALPGLTLSSKRYSDCESILATFAKYCSEGMVPNKFPDWSNEPLMYNTIDASLWLFYTVWKYLEYTGNYEFIKNSLYSSMKEIIMYHIEGTRYDIKVDSEDGMICGGSKESQLTWMDVRYKGWAVTPRYGKAVEINALWYNSLKVMECLSEKFGESNEIYKFWYRKVEKNFEPLFFNVKKGCLFDYIADGIKNSDIRPNQIIAVSLPFSPLRDELQKQVVDTVYKKNFTNVGLRTLSTENDKYIGIYRGTLFERDSAYHQGTVWTWIMGHFITAYKKVYGGNNLNYIMEGIKHHFYNEGCIKNISEIFDGDVPHVPRGCCAQAWSVAEVLRVLVEELEIEKNIY